MTGVGIRVRQPAPHTRDWTRREQMADDVRLLVIDKGLLCII